MTPPTLPCHLTLSTERLTLRPLQPSDATALFALQSDPDVMRYWHHAAWHSRQQAEAAIAAALDNPGNGLTLGLCEQSSGQLIGTCLVFAYEPESGRAEIGYNLSPGAQGRGYMHEALYRLVGWLFQEHGLRRLEAEIDPRNTASAHVLMRLGFRQEGYQRARWCIDGAVSDSALYGLLAKDWPAASQAADPDADLASLTREQLVAEVKRLRTGIRTHRDTSGHDLCWYHPHLWSLLPEPMTTRPIVPDWPAFMQGCVRYRASLDT